ncbi:MAG: hypothetical protein HY560_00795 [Gemmatimonadetes bacterium]|nr:hypothetical protein [Gemmatimonadota bacterium]
MRVSARLFLVGLALAGAGVLTNCQLGELVRPSAPARLVVSPPELADSAALGSTLALSVTLSVRGDPNDGILWRASTARGSPWLALGQSESTAPATLDVALMPGGLGAGQYHDTIVVESRDRTDDVVRVPVMLSIRPCFETALAMDTEVIDSLTPADCPAPHRAGRVARLYSFQGSADDSVSVALISSAFDPYLVLDTSIAGPALAENDNCSPAGPDACLHYVRLPRSGRFILEATSVAPGERGRFRLQLSRPHPPEPPGALRQFRGDSTTAIGIGGTLSEPAIVFQALVADPDAADLLRLEVEVKPVGTAFTGSGTTLGEPAPGGGSAFTRLNGPTDETSYHWRARTVDPTGRAGGWMSYGGNPEDAADFTFRRQQAPQPPTDLGQFKIDGATVIPVGGSTDERTVVLRGRVSGTGPGDRRRLEVEVQPLGAPFTGKASAASTEVDGGTSATAMVSGLADNTAYRWQARTLDHDGNPSAWVGFGGNGEDADFQIATPTTRLAFVVQPTNTAAGATITPAVQVAAQDASGNTITTFTGSVTIAIGSNPGGGRLSGTTTVPAANGVATFSTLSIDAAGSGYTLAATATGLPGVTSATFDVQSTAATRLVFTVEPTDAVAGTPFSPAVRVTAQDAQGNTATGFTGTISVAIGTNPGGGTLSGTVSVAAQGGIATFSNLSINKAGTGYTLTATAAGLTGATSATFAITPGAASQLAFTVQPSDTRVNQPITPAVQVSVRDAFGNTVTGFTGQVTVSIARDGSVLGNATLSGKTVVNAVGGVATFSDLSIDQAGGGYTLAATAAGVAGSATSQSFDVALL